MEIAIFFIVLFAFCVGVVIIRERQERRLQAQADLLNEQFHASYNQYTKYVSKPGATFHPAEHAVQTSYGAPTNNDDSDFLLSAAIGAATGSALAGGLVGGSFIGGMIGEELAAPSQSNDDPTPDNQCVPDDNNDCSSSDSSSSSEDSSSSYDSSSSDSSSYDSGSSDSSGGSDW